MRIGIDATPLRSPGTGIAVYTEQLALALAAERPKDQFILLSHVPVTLETKDVPPNLEIKIDPSPLRSMTGWVAARTPALARRLNLDLFHFTNNGVAPLSMPCPHLATVHGLAPVALPKCYPLKSRVVSRFWWPLALRRTRKVLVLSERSAEEIHREFAIPRRRIGVVPLAAAPLFHERSWDEGNLKQLRARYRLPEKFILNAATWQPVKNQRRALEAFELARRMGLRHSLVFAGPEGWGSPQPRERELPPHLRGQVRILRRVSQPDLAGLYRLSEFFFYPSLYEAFCLPNLEAMACGTPVLTSNAPNISDVVADAALQADPSDVPAMARALIRMAEDADLREALRRKGLERARQFCWRRTAQETWQAYEEVLSDIHAN